MALVQITDRARDKVEGFKAGADDGERQAMWVEVTGVQGGGWTYNMSLKPLDQAAPDDAVQHEGELAVVVPARDADALRGATIDWSDDLMRGGLTIDNPNTPSPAMGDRPPADLSGPLPQRVA